INTKIGDIVYSSFDCDIEIKIYNKLYKLSKFDKYLNVSLINLLNVSKEIVENYNQTPEQYICIDCLDDIAKKYDLNITVIPIIETNPAHIWFLLNTKKKIENKFLIWRFVTDLK
ncbi:hypothetical protein, partial [Escherichia coli]|uniref:hypothetical protein n=1 Tax=Escherichia coli TaxID=562 RepID=UPI0013874166